MEARSVSRGYYEETVTDSEGKYRLRGLLPSTQYIIKAALKVDRPGLNKIERSSPNGTLVEVIFSFGNLFLSLWLGELMDYILGLLYVAASILQSFSCILRLNRPTRLILLLLPTIFAYQGCWKAFVLEY